MKVNWKELRRRAVHLRDVDWNGYPTFLEGYLAGAAWREDRRSRRKRKIPEPAAPSNPYRSGLLYERTAFAAGWVEANAGVLLS